MEPAQPAAAAAAAPPPAVDDMHIDVVAPAPLPLAASLPPDMPMQTPHPLPPGDGVQPVQNPDLASAAPCGCIRFRCNAILLITSST
jgi:hypothetical protein